MIRWEFYNTTLSIVNNLMCIQPDLCVAIIYPDFTHIHWGAKGAGLHFTQNVNNYTLLQVCI